jgi:uncharacterized repeat protein (TIGR03803 family)
VAAARAADNSYSILHSFQGGESNPYAPLTSDGRGNLYGTTINGGAADYGTVFTVRADGTGFQRLHTFTNANDGFSPVASLILDGAGNLFGITAQGGSSGGGTLFTIRVDGGGFQVLHSFGGGASEGKDPYGALTLDGSGTLYGTTSAGGPSNFGIVFKLRTDGTLFQVLHSFAGGPSDGRGPYGSLLLDGLGNVYGTTFAGGQPFKFNPFGDIDDGEGTVFRIKTDGTGYQILRAFQDDANDAAYPSGSLTADGSGNLYGMTVGGGSSRAGTVFRIGMDGSGFQILHSFAGGASDERNPVGSLVLDRSGNLYGMTGAGGASSFQAGIFKIRTDGTGYQLLHTFVDTSDGSLPLGSLILDGSETLYGAMTFGGSSNSGTVFSINTDGSLFHVVRAFAGFVSDGGSPSASVISDGLGYLYGTTTYGGSSYVGTVFRIRSNGTRFQILHAFSGGANDGDVPVAPLILDRAGNLYGTTNAGGPSNNGTVFKVRTDGTGFELLHAFLGRDIDGRGPSAALILDGSDNLYGTTFFGGPSDAGTVFRMKTDGSGYQLLHTFSFASPSDDGAAPCGPLVLDGSGNLYGATLFTVFRMKTDGTGFRSLHAFTNRADDGRDPGSLSIDGFGFLYGTTGRGGSSDAGTIYKMKTDGTSFQLVHSFTDSVAHGAGPAPVILDGFGNLYGATLYGGPSDFGTVFTVKTDGTGFRILHAFGGEAGDGREPVASLLLDGSGVLFGTTVSGGAGGFGTVFALSIGRHHAVVTPGPFVPVRKR